MMIIKLQIYTFYPYLSYNTDKKSIAYLYK